MDDIVILTPTYNRADKLPRLYKSLKSQNTDNFKWVIIDDGSRDNTDILVERMKEENILNIEYIYQKNGGKARAINKGFSECKNAQVYIIVDSDDYLLPNAITTVENYLNYYGENSIIGSFFFHYKTTDGKILKPNGKLIENDYITDPYDYNRHYGKNDGCICFLKRSTEKYKYPQFEGEKYVAPTVMLMEMSNEFKIVYSPEVIGIAEYQKGGLTNSGRGFRLKNPNGMIHYAKLMMSRKASIKDQIKYAISIWPYAKLANKSFFEILKIIERPILTIATFLPGQILYFIWKRKLKEN